MRIQSEKILTQIKRLQGGGGGEAKEVGLAGSNCGNYRLAELEVAWTPWKRQSPPTELSS